MNYEQAKEHLVATMQSQNYAADTQKKFKAALNYICSFYTKYNSVETLTIDEVTAFLDFLSFEKNLSPSTVNNYLGGLKFLFENVFHREWPKDISYLNRPRNRPTIASVTAPPPQIRPVISLEKAIPILIQHMELRGNASGTQAAYIRSLRKFAIATKIEHNLNLMTLDDIQNFLHHELYVCKRNPQTVNCCRTALKFTYTVLLDKQWDDLKIPSHKFDKHVPAVLSPDEVLKLINAIENPVYKLVATLMYSSGLRVSEAIKIKISDIDSKNMQILITNTKTHKDRYALLSHECLLALREYYKIYRPTNYLFPGQRYNLHISKESIQTAVRVAALKIGITKKVSSHTLRHCFATHLLQNDTNLYYIKQLLGHSSLRSTSHYLHTISFSNMNIKSPLDLVGGLK